MPVHYSEPPRATKPEATTSYVINEQHPHGGDWLRELIFGLNDGLVTTLVFVMAVSRVANHDVVPVVLGEMLAGGVSMTLGAYLSAQTVRDILAHRVAVERHEIAHEPEEERAELRLIYQRKGFAGPLLEGVVHHLTADKERWLQAMVSDELGILDERVERPLIQGLLVGTSFVAGAVIPALPFMLGLPRPEVWAFLFTALVALLIGAIKARYTLKSALRNGLELLVVVAIGTGAGVGIGAILHTL